MKRILAASLTVLLLAPFAPLRAAEAKPNIIIFLVDDMGVMDTSVPFLTDAAGKPKRYPLNDYYRTPNMERLAARGIRFNNFYAMSVCSPTRAAILTGQNAARHHITNWINPDTNNAGPQGPPQWNWKGLKKGDVTLPRLLQAAGYRTIHVGKGHFLSL
ncbi:MAG: sulfatase-like hydrolase/transferase, partial [Verrucomicrobiae bacterium]|nr:sulfatase-like hydrolase/transferase [Verrucomicrobiae bacterium]